MTKKEWVWKSFEELGYTPQEDDDGDVMVRYQMKEIFAIIGEEEEKYLILMLPQFSDIEEGEEILTLATCNKVTRELKLGKVYIDQTFKHISASCEFLYTDEESLRQYIDRSLRILGIVRSIYRNAKMEMAE